MMSQRIQIALLAVQLLSLAGAFSPVPIETSLRQLQVVSNDRVLPTFRHCPQSTSSLFSSSNDDSDEAIEVSAELVTEEEKAEAVGNLVANVSTTQVELVSQVSMVFSD